MAPKGQSYDEDVKWSEKTLKSGFQRAEVSMSMQNGQSHEKDTEGPKLRVKEQMKYYRV